MFEEVRYREIRWLWANGENYMKLFLSMAGPLARLTGALMIGSALTTGGMAADLPDYVAPEAAAPDMQQVSGTVALFGAYTLADGDGFDGDGWLLGGDAKANVWLTPSVSTQFDLRGEAGRYSEDDGGGTQSESRVNFTAGGHLTWRNPEMYALGVFGGISGGSILDEVGDETRYFIGLEGQYYLNDITLYGQVGFSDIVEGDDDHSEMTEAWFARGVARWFVTANDKIEGEFGYYYSDDIVTGGQGPVTNYNWGALYEHRFMTSPFSAYVEYDGLSRDDDSHGDDGVVEHIFMVGARIHFGQPDLKTADRYGATLDLPDVIRTENWADIAH